jgi:hypothetical protein
MRRMGCSVLAAGLLAIDVRRLGAAPSHGVSKGSGSQSCSPLRAAEAGTTARTQLDGLFRKRGEHGARARKSPPFSRVDRWQRQVARSQDALARAYVPFGQADYASET